MDNFIEVTKRQFHKAMRKRFKNSNDYIFEEVKKQQGNIVTTITKFVDIQSKRVLAFILDKEFYFIRKELA